MNIIIVPANHTCGQMSLQPLPLVVPLERENCLRCRYITTSLYTLYIHGLVMFGLDSLRLQLSGFDIYTVITCFCDHVPRLKVGGNCHRGC